MIEGNNTGIYTACLTFLTAFFAGLWGYLNKNKEIVAGKGCSEKIEALKEEHRLELDGQREEYLLKMKEMEEALNQQIGELKGEMIEERFINGQIVTGVRMLLVVFEDEFGEKLKYNGVIKEVRGFINTKRKNVDK